MKLDFEFACDQLNSTNHSLLLELSSSASCQHVLTMCIRSCTYMDTLPLSEVITITSRQHFAIPRHSDGLEVVRGNFVCLQNDRPLFLIQISCTKANMECSFLHTFQKLNWKAREWSEKLMNFHIL